MDESTAAPIPPAPGPIAKAVATVATAEKNQQVPRLWLWMIAAAILAVLVGMIAPQQVGNVLMKTLLVFMAGITSYFLDRALFLFVEVKLDESLPHDAIGAARIVARALIFVGCVMGYGLAV